MERQRKMPLVAQTSRRLLTSWKASQSSRRTPPDEEEEEEEDDDDDDKEGHSGGGGDDLARAEMLVRSRLKHSRVGKEYLPRLEECVLSNQA
eukprot:484664-Amphidinium_carterae.3